MEASKRRSDSGAPTNQPAVQVVGFHVEGQSPSPRPASVLQAEQDSLKKITTGSPVPVIIPPSFQSMQDAGSGPSRAAAPPTVAAAAAAALAGAPSDAGASSSDGASAPPGSASKPPTPPAQRADGGASRQPTPAADGAAAASSQAPQPAAAMDDAGHAGAAGQRPPSKTPSKAAMTKAERRALQEAQRAAKAAKAGAGGAPAPTAGSNAGPASSRSEGGVSASGRPSSAKSQGADRASRSSDAADGAGGTTGDRSRSSGGAAPRTGQSAFSAAAAGAGTTRDLFSHLPQYKAVSVESVLVSGGSTVHPAILALGLRYADGSIRGGNARALALVQSMSKVIADYKTPEGKSLSRDLGATINNCVDFLVRCRPLSVSMGNTIKHLKLKVSKIPPDQSDEEAKAQLQQALNDYVNEKILVADRVLVQHAVSKLCDGDVILTYAYSSVVLEVLLKAAEAGRRFRVVVLDSRPELEGRQLMKRLLQASVPCTYVLLSGLSYIMREVTKVVLGASAVLSNGTVMGRAGSAVVAMAASSANVPVLVCCEAYKFHERVQLDSITHNELGDPNALAALPPGVVASQGVPTGAGDYAASLSPASDAPAAGAAAAAGPPPLQEWQSQPRLQLLNLKYDLMPAEYVTMVVTEFGMVPPTSVAVILREYMEAKADVDGSAS